MGQPRIATDYARIPGQFALAASLLLSAFAFGCRKSDSPAAPPQSGSAPAGAEPRVASVTPAGTDLLIGMGAAEHLVGVSTYDDPRLGIAGKPKIGDYQTIDWEKLAPLHAQVLLLQYAPDRIPAGAQEHCKELGIQIVNLQIEILDDIYSETNVLAAAIGEPAKGAKAVTDLKAKLAAVQTRVAGLPRVKTLLVTNETGFDVAGSNTFLDQLLTIAGGQNVASGLGKRYASIDREMILSMAPDVVIQMIPDGDKTPQVLESAKQFWATLPDLPAVKNHRVVVITSWYLLQPGFEVGETARQFADILHPASENPTTTK